MTGKTCFLLFSSVIYFTLAPDCHSLPKDPCVAIGSAEFTQVDPHSMEIRPSNQAIINYSKFDIGKHEKVRFIQNNSSSSVLNRVQGQDPSQIFGSLESNGKVFLVNPNGIYFGPDSKVNVGSLIASTLDIANEDFLNEKYQFNLGKDSFIKSEGLLQSLEGSIVLMAPKIHNLGSIKAKAGTVLLASGEHITLDFVGDGLVQFSVEGSLKESLIEHLGEIKGSNVSVKLPVAKKAIQEIVNLEGMEEGDVFIEENGTIKFASISSVTSKQVLLEGGNVSIEGRIDASSLIDKGGEVHLFGRDITLQGAQIDVSGQLGGGEVLIGGQYQGRGTTPYASKVVMDETSQILASAIESGNGGLVVLWSQDETAFDGDIFSRGGSLDGNGGIVETSSRNFLNIVKGYVNTEGPKGSYGSWLLDPYTLTIYPTGGGSCPNECDNSSNVFCTEGYSILNNAISNIYLQANIINLEASISLQPNIGITFASCSGGASTANLTASITTNNGYVTFDSNMQVVLGTAVTIATSGGDITFGNTVNGAQTLIIDADDGIVSFNGTVGGSTKLTSLQVTSASSIVFAANVSTTDTIAITPAITLNGSSTLLSQNGPITFSSTVSGTQNLGINAGAGVVSLQALGATSLGLTPIQNISIVGGTVTLGGAVATTGASPNGGVTISNSGALTINSGDISASGDFMQTGSVVSLGNQITANSIAFEGAITLLDNITLTSMGDITLSSDVGASSAGAQSLTLSAAGSVNTQDLGVPTALGAVSLTAYTDSFIQNIITESEAITLSAPSFTLGGGGALSIDSTSGGSFAGALITINGDLSATTSGAESLTLNATGGGVAGVITLTGSIGDIPLSSLTIQGSSSIANSEVHIGDSTAPTAVTNVNVTGAIVVNPLLILDSFVTMTGGSIELLATTEPLTSGVQGLTLNATGAITTSQLGTNGNPLGPVSLTASAPSFLQTILTGGGSISLSAPSFSLSPVSGNIIYIDSSSGGSFEGAPITISGSVQATTSGVESLQIRAIGQNIAGLITLKGSLGDNTLPLGFLTILGDSSLYASQLILGDSSLSSVSITAAGPIDMSTLYGITLASNTSLTTTNSIINMANAEINGDSAGGQTLTLSAGTSIIDLGAAGFKVPVGIVQVTADLFHLSGIRTKGAPIHIDAVTNLKIESVTLDTTNNGTLPNGADIFFASTVDSAKNLSITAGNDGVITFSADVGGIDLLESLTITSGADVFTKNIKTIGNLTIAPHITLSDTLNVFSSSSEGAIALGDIDGISSGPQSLTVNTSGAVALGVIGARTPLLDIQVPTGTSATIHSIQVNGVIAIDIPLILATSSTLHTPESITHRSINGTSNGGESLTIISAGDVFFKENIGDPKNGNPIGDLDVTGSSILLQGTLVTTSGTQTYHSPVTVLQNMRFNSLGNITFESTVDPESGAPSMALYPGSGTLTFADSVGDAPFGNIVVYNAGSFSAQDIFANSLVISGGLPSIFLNGNITLSGRGVFTIDGGPIYFGGDVDVKRLWFRSHGSMSNLGSPQPINVSEYGFPDFQYLNAVNGVIGSKSSPIEINVDKVLLLGADPRADFIGIPMHRTFKALSSNPPCVVTFNGVTIFNCNTTDVDAEALFNSVARNLLYVPGLYSSWDNLSNFEYFQEEPSNLGFNIKNEQFLYWAPSRYFLEEPIELEIPKTPEIPDFYKLDEFEECNTSEDDFLSAEPVLIEKEEISVTSEIENVALEEVLVETAVEEPDLNEVLVALETEEVYIETKVEETPLKEVLLALEPEEEEPDFANLKEVENITVIEEVLIKEIEKPLTKMIVEVIALPQLQTVPQKECVNWEFSMRFVDVLLPLHLVVDTKDE